MLLLGLLLVSTPRIERITVHTNRQSYLQPTLPVEWYVLNNTKGTGSVTVILNHTRAQSTIFLIRADDCIDLFTINGVIVEKNQCSYGVRKNYNLQPYLVDGLNTMTFNLHNVIADRMGVDLMASPTGDRLGILARIFLLILILWISIVLLREKISKDPWLTGVFLSGCIVRIAYTGATWFNLRSYDADAHLDYIRFLATSWSLPPASGWELHQPPLYYLLPALLLRLSRAAGWSDTTTFTLVQQGSLFLSICTMLLGIWIGTLLFSGPRKRAELIAFCALVTTLPGLAMLSSRISNDVLITPLLMLGMGLLITYWQRGSQESWYNMSVVLGLGFLTKLTSLVLLPPMLIALIARRSLPPRLTRQHLLASCLVLLALISPLLIGRLLQNERDTRNFLALGNSHGIDGRLKLDRDPKRFLVFNPIEIIRHPFNAPWGTEERRQYYPEYLFRSAFFGEFSRYSFATNALGTPILLFATILLLWLLWGFEQDIGKRPFASLPLWATAITVIGAAITYAVLFPNAPAQDFRFSPLLGVLGAYYIAIGIGDSSRVLRTVGLLLVGIVSVLCSIFLLGQ